MWPRIWLSAALLSVISACASPPPKEAPERVLANTPGPTIAWPIEGGRVSSGFGSPRGSSRHLGIDIRITPGTPIRAAAAGRVHFSGRMRGYGNVVILYHGNGLETRYAHNRSNAVEQGSFVHQGEIVATVGSSGNATAPHVHFDVRENGRPRDPLAWLGTR